MKRFVKALCLMLCVAMTAVTCLSLVACENIKKLEVKVSVYDIGNSKQVEKTITVKLYRHLAPDTVDAILTYAKEGFYDGLPFYKLNDYSSQIMAGDYEFTDGALKLYNAEYVKSTEGEFEKAGTVGSNLKNAEGYIGLWRTWEASSSYNKNSDAAFNSGKATVYMPTADISGYDGNFCVFGMIDLEDEITSETVSLVKAVFGDSDNTVSYTVYYTGEYGEQGEKLEYHCELTTDFDEKMEDDDFSDSVFKAEGTQFVCFNSRKITVPVNSSTNQITAQIVSVKVK